MTEREFQGQVIEVAHLLGWRVAHFRPARTAHGWRTPVAADGQGWPDLFMVRGNRSVAAELKSETGKLSDDQRLWLDSLEAAGVEVHSWRPDDFDDVARALR